MHRTQPPARLPGVRKRRSFGDMLRAILPLLLLCAGPALAGRSGALRVGELAARLQVVHHTAVSLVDGLVARKLVVRLRAVTDRRVVLLHVTTRGLRLIRRVSAENRIELRRLRPELLSFLRRLGA